MPLIKPPSDYGLPESEFLEDKPDLSERQIWERNRKVAIYMNVKPWKCNECGCVNFGRNKQCVYCKIRLGKITLTSQNLIYLKDGRK